MSSELGSAHLTSVLRRLLHLLRSTALFLEKRDALFWHSGLALPNSRLQVSPLKDCVTLVDPTSPYSFLNNLAVHGRLYSFVNKRNASTSRQEFIEYYRWVAGRLNTLRFSEDVMDVVPFTDGYRISTNTTTYLARAVVVGVGVEPKIPPCARSLLCDTVFHAADYLERQLPHAAEHVLVVEGGQSGAEIIEDMLTRSVSTQITWATSRSNLFSMDDNSFVNKTYTPSYSRRFHALPLQQRRDIVEGAMLTSDGNSVDLCNRLYEMLYERSVDGTLADRFRVLSSIVVKDSTSHKKRWRVDLDEIATQRNSCIHVDRIVLGTGFQPRTPPFLEASSRVRVWKMACPYSARTTQSASVGTCQDQFIYKIKAACSTDCRVPIYLWWRTATAKY